MEVDKNSPPFLAAMRDFRRARQQAILEDIMAHLTGKSDNLLDYDEVYEKLRAGRSEKRGLQEIPLEAIVGSVGRYTDFTRSFLPRSKRGSKRWAEVKAAIIQMGKIPPITVYQIDRVYFVLDGNHRVSIARQRGDIHIPAYVIEIHTEVPVPLSPDVKPDELIIKARHAEFLAHTRLHEVRPEADLSVTNPGQYRILEAQIDLYHHWLRQQKGQDVSIQEASEYWYDMVYWPGIQLIRERGLLHHFPNRTETDLYAWIVRHQSELREELGWEIEPEAAADDLVDHFSNQPQQFVKRVKKKLRRSLVPEPLEAGPPPGQWRREQLPAQHRNQLFVDILVAVTGEKANWAGVTQALEVARLDKGRLHGLHVVASASEKAESRNQTMQEQFKQRCEAANIPGQLSFEIGKPIRTICDRARWADLVVIHLSHLPRPQPGDRLMSGFGTLVRSCPRPVLAASGEASPLTRALLAYDGSPKANEALFVAAYLAGKWNIPLVVVTVLEEGHITSNTLASAQEYLEARGVQAEFVQEQGTIAWAIIRTAQLYECDFMIMGGYGFSPALEIMLGSEVDQILRAKKWPVLICR